MAKVSTLTETFASEDTGKWSGYADTANVNATGGQLVIACTADYPALVSAVSYDLAASAIVVQAVQTPNVGVGSTMMTLRLGQDTNGEGDGFSIIWAADWLMFGEWVSGAHNNTGIDWDPVAHAWWRIREASNIVYWETSPDGLAWTVQRSKTKAVSTISALYVVLQSGFWDAETSAGTAIFDNVNNVPGVGNFFQFFLDDMVGATAADSLPTVGLSWLTPKYFVNGTGTQTFNAAAQFTGPNLVYGLQGSPPGGVSINSSTGVVSVSTSADIAWSTLTVRATNSAGYAEVTVDVWVFTPDHTITTSGALAALSPSAGDIVAVRTGTYSAEYDMSGWSGSSGNPTIVVAYPGDAVTFSATSLTDYNIYLNAAHDIEIRGFEMVDDGGCYWPFRGPTAYRITIAQCTIHGYKRGLDTAMQDRTVDRPWTIEYCRVYDCVQENNPTGLVESGWARAVNVNFSGGSVVRRNWIYENYGEGLGTQATTSADITENVIYDNYSVNLYIDNGQHHDVSGNIVWSDNSDFYRDGDPALSIAVANEDYYGTIGSQTGPRELATLDVVVTNNRYLVTNAGPQYLDFGDSGGAGECTFSPNSTFTTVDSRWR